MLHTLLVICSGQVFLFEIQTLSFGNVDFSETFFKNTVSPRILGESFNGNLTLSLVNYKGG